MWCTAQGPLCSAPRSPLALRNKYLTVFEDFSESGISPQQVAQSAGMKTPLIFLRFQLLHETLKRMLLSYLCNKVQRKSSDSIRGHLQLTGRVC